MSLKYEILNTSGITASGQMGLEWTLYSINLKDPHNPKIVLLRVKKAKSESVNDQLEAIAELASCIVGINGNVQLADVLITGEYLTIAPGTKSIVKQAFLNLITVKPSP